MSKFTHALRNIDDFLFSRRWLSLVVILLITVFFAIRIPGVQIYSDFADLLPQKHPYIKLHNQIRDVFGGANIVIVGVEVKDGTIFTNETLALIYRLTQAVDSLPGVNHNLVSSLTHRTVRKVWLNETGSIISDPYYDPRRTDLTQAELDAMRNDVLADPRVYGLLVSPDLKSALIKAQLNEGSLDYKATFEKLQKIRAAEEANGKAAGVSIYATGQPVLIGWVYTYLGELLQIFLYTLVIMFGLLVLYFRRLYGVMVPLIGVTLSAIWGMGIISLLGYNLDPLTLVIPFLILARSLSHGIQLVERYYGELEIVRDSRQAARQTFDSLFRPGSLGVVSDAIGLSLIMLGSIPINTKLSHYASLWALSVIINVLLFVPLLLSVLPQPRNADLKHGAFRSALAGLGDFVASRKGAVAILVAVVGLYFVGGYYSSWVQIGDSKPGSPLLYPDHDYNVSSKAINARFPGSEELYIVARTDKKGGLKRPEVLYALEDFQAYMMDDPELGGTKGLPDLIKQVNRLLHNDDPRWSVIPDSDAYVGGLMFAYMASSPIPGALKEFLNPEETEANMVFYYKDHRGETIKRAISMVKAWAADVGNRVDGLSIQLAGGIVGVTAAINDAVFTTNMIVVPLVLLLIFISVTLFYWSWHAGWLMFLAMSFATILSYAYLGFKGIGLNINTVPIIAVGIGVGIDYSIYMMDRVREEMALCGNLIQSVKRAVSTTGLAILVTATTLVSGVILWVFMSTLRFQADAALLLSVMIVLNMLAAMFLVPAWIVLFKPKFITAAYGQEDGLLEAAQ